MKKQLLIIALFLTAFTSIGQIIPADRQKMTYDTITKVISLENSDPVDLSGLAGTALEVLTQTEFDALTSLEKAAFNGVIVTPGWSASSTVDVKKLGAKGDWNGVTGTDDYAVIQNAIDTYGHVYIPEGRYKISQTLKTRAGTHLEGSGAYTSLYLDGISGPGILTYSGSGSNTAPNQLIENFTITGSATVGIAFSHFVNSSARNILCQETTNLGYSTRNTLNTTKYAFCFEYLWGSTFESLNSAGGVNGEADFKVNDVVLATTFTNLYTSNWSPYNFLIKKDKEYSTGTNVGVGNLTFINPVAQGASVYGLRIDGYSEINIQNIYMENSNGIRLGNGTTAINFYGGFFGKHNVGSPTHGLYIGEVASTGSVTGNISFNNIIFYELPIILGGRIWTQGIMFNGCSIVGSTSDIHTLFRKTSYTDSALPISVSGATNGGSSFGDNVAFVFRTQNWGHELVKLSPKADGTWQAATFVPATLEVSPRTE